MLTVLAKTDFTSEVAEQLLAKIPDWRRSECTKLRRVADQRANIAVFALLEAAWRKIAAFPLPEIVRLASGKLVFRDVPDWFFSFSHQDGWAACALSKDPVGVDIHPRISYHLDFFTEIAVDAEKSWQQYLAELNDLGPLWTRKEAWWKMAGQNPRDLLRTGTSAKPVLTWRNADLPLNLSLAGTLKTLQENQSYLFDLATESWLPTTGFSRVLPESVPEVRQK